jgi:hypothetical protein
MHPSDSPDRRVAPAEAVPPAATDEIEAIMEAVSAGEPPVRGPDARRDTIAPSLASPVTTRATRATRWAMPSVAARVVTLCIAAFVCGSLVALWAVRLLERQAPIQRLSINSRRDAPAPGPTLISARRVWPMMGPLATAIAAMRIAPVSRGEPDHRRAPVAPPVAIAIRPAPRAETADRSGADAPPVAWSALTHDVPARDSTAIIGSLPLADTAPAVPPPVVPVGRAAPAPVAVVPGGEADAVRQTIARYETAIDQMNVGAAAAVFPSVDTLALARAFSALKQHSVDFERCDVAMMTATATVRCLGTTHYVVKVGTPTPRSRRYEWTFTLEKVGSAWKIGEMATTAIGTAARAENSTR